MDIPKQMSEDRIGGQGLPRKEGQGLPEAFRRGNRMRPQAGLQKNGDKVEKVTEKQRAVWTGASQTDCLIPAHAYLDGHDGAFSLRKYLCGAAGELFRAGRTDARQLA